MAAEEEKKQEEEARKLGITLDEFKQLSEAGISIEQMRQYQNNVGSKHGRITMNSLLGRTDAENTSDGARNRYKTDGDSEEEEEDEDMIDEEKLKRFSKFNFSGLSFKDYVGKIDKRQVNNEMYRLV